MANKNANAIEELMATIDKLFEKKKSLERSIEQEIKQKQTELLGLDIQAYIVNRMKSLDVRQIYVREAEDAGNYFYVDGLVYTNENGNRMAVRVIRRNEDDTLTLISNGYSESSWGDECEWDYSEKDIEEPFKIEQFGENTLMFIEPFVRNEELYTDFQTSEYE